MSRLILLREVYIREEGLAKVLSPVFVLAITPLLLYNSSSMIREGQLRLLSREALFGREELNPNHWPLSEDFVLDVVKQLGIEIELDNLHLIYPWDLLDSLGRLNKDKGTFIDPTALIGDGVKVDDSRGAIIIGPHVKIFENTVIKGPVVLSDSVLVGSHTVIRNSLVFPRVQVGSHVDLGHSIMGADSRTYSKLVDAIIGEQAWITGNVTASSLKIDEESVQVMVGGTLVNTNKDRVGLVMGRNAVLGAGSIVYPGVFIGENSKVLPGTVVDAHIPGNCVVKPLQTVQIIENVPHAFNRGNVDQRTLRKNG